MINKIAFNTYVLNMCFKFYTDIVLLNGKKFYFIPGDLDVKDRNCFSIIPNACSKVIQKKYFKLKYNEQYVYNALH